MKKACRSEVSKLEEHSKGCLSAATVDSHCYVIETKVVEYYLHKKLIVSSAVRTIECLV